MNFEIIGTRIPRTRMNRFRKALIRLSLAVFVCAVFTVARGWAQSPDDTETSPTQTPQMPMGQDRGGQPVSQDSDQAPAEAEPPAQMEPMPTDTTQENQTMSATQIIGILQAEPDALEAIRNQIAQESGVDPTTLTDGAVQERIRESEETRVLATKELVARGYSINAQERTSPTSTAAGTRTTGTTGRGTQPPRQAATPYENPDNPQVQHQKMPYTNIPSLT
ncbi:MAG: hypothetical protein ABR928_22275, partial [Terracidiphilus sp.]